MAHPSSRYVSRSSVRIASWSGSNGVSAPIAQSQAKTQAFSASAHLSAIVDFPLPWSPVTNTITDAAWQTGRHAGRGLLPAPVASGSVSLPSVEGPIGGDAALVSTSFDLATVGYGQQEYLVHGTAQSFTSTEALTADGRWTVSPAEEAPYTTRIVVYRPVDPATFRGAVVVEWLNVSAGFDTAPDWLAAHNVAIREGVTWICVSAQAAGVQGDGPAAGGSASGGLRASDPVRYATLQHPGDSFSYDIFSQVGQLVRGGAPPDLLGTAPVTTVVAIGESQSAFRLVTYVNAVHQSSQVFDGYLIHSRAGSTAALAQAPLAEIPAPDGTIVRTDLNVPVLVFQTETELTLFDYLPARQPDTERIRLWEVAGTAHADAYTAGIGFNDTGTGRAEDQLLDVRSIDGGPLACGKPVNAGPAYAVLQAAVHALIRWSCGGDAPAIAPRLELTSDEPLAIALDANGNALGGVRTPLVDVPTAALCGDGNDGESFCRLFGTTTPFDAAQLRSRYPNHESYTSRFNEAADAAVRNGFLLREEADNMKRAAARSTVPGT